MGRRVSCRWFASTWLGMVGLSLMIGSTHGYGAETVSVTQIHAINPLLPATMVEARRLTTKLWATDTRGRDSLQPFEADGVIALGPIHFVAEKGSGRWLVGRRYDDVFRRTSEIRCRLAFDSLTALLETAKYPPLPEAPAEYKIREVARFPYRPVQMLLRPDEQQMYVLLENGDVWNINPANGERSEVIRGADYLDRSWGDFIVRGMALDSRNRLYLAINQKEAGGIPITNNVMILRTIREVNGHPAGPAPWFRTSYPWGVEPFNFGIGPIAFGPDGMLYVSSGGRTDAGEPGADGRFWQGGENELTGCLWRLDPNTSSPHVDVFVRGLRCSRGFCWDQSGRLLATDIGSDGVGSAELNLLQTGRHYGFPYRFSNSMAKPYPYTPAEPSGVEFAAPLPNIGPAGGFTGEPLYTFDPFSNPTAVVAANDRVPKRYRRGLLVARFGNELPQPKDVGFDVLFCELSRPAGEYQLETHRFLTGVARPIALLTAPDGRIFVCEHSRATSNNEFASLLPGRLLELTPQ